MPVTQSLITINPQDPVPLVEQVVIGIKQLVEQRVLRTGTRLPSIRDFALQHGISRFMVVLRIGLFFWGVNGPRGDLPTLQPMA